MDDIAINQQQRTKYLVYFPQMGLKNSVVWIAGTEEYMHFTEEDNFPLITKIAFVLTLSIFVHFYP